jgi:hypothetical protein
MTNVRTLREAARRCHVDFCASALELTEEKVDNGADLENAPALWARNKDTEYNCRLAEHHAGRSSSLIDDWGEDRENRRVDLRPSQVTGDELWTFGWAQDPISKDEISLLPGSFGAAPASIVNAQGSEFAR